MQVQTGKTYKVFGKVQRVVQVDSHYIHTIWPNGMTPAQQADRLYPIEWAKHFVEVSPVIAIGSN